MPRHFQSNVGPLKPQTAPLPISDRHVAPLPNCALPQRFARVESHCAPVRTLPAIVAAITIAMWTPTVGAQAVALPHAQAPSVAAPEKVITAAAPITVAGWTPGVSLSAKEFQFNFDDRPVAPPFAKFVSPFTLASWMPDFQPPRVPPFFLRAESAAPPIAPYVSPFTLASWLGEVPPPAKRFAFTPGDTFTAPAKVLPPAAITIANWFGTDGRVAVRNTFAVPEPFTAPAKFGIAVPAIVSLEAWLGEVAGPAKRFTFAPGDTFTAPAKVLPPAAITIANWFGTDGSAAVRYTYSQAPSSASPDKVITASAPITIANWMPNMGARALSFTHARAPIAAPDKVLAGG